MSKIILLKKVLILSVIFNFIFVSHSFSQNDTKDDTSNEAQNGAFLKRAIINKLKLGFENNNTLANNSLDKAKGSIPASDTKNTFDTTIDGNFDTTISDTTISGTTIPDTTRLDTTFNNGNKQEKIDSSIKQGTDSNANTQILEVSESVQEFAIEKAKRDFKAAISTKDDKIISKAQLTLIQEYEKAISLVCMPNFYKEATYEVNNGNEKCYKLTHELLTIYPYSPIGLCAKYGYQNKNCLEAYTHIIVLTSFPKDDDNKDIPELTELFKKLNNAKLPKLKADYERGKSTYLQHNSTKNFMSVIASADKAVNIICSKKMETYSDKCTSCKNDEEKVDIENLDLFADIKKDLGLENLKKDVDALTNNKKGENNDKKYIKDKKVDKIIHITSDCKKFLEDIATFEPKYPSSICILNGAYSPKCLNALKDWSLYIKSKYAIEHRKKKPKIVATKDTTTFESF